MTFTMPSGHRVTVRPLFGGLTEFETRGPAGDVISNVVQSDAFAVLTVRSLEANAR